MQEGQALQPDDPKATEIDKVISAVHRNIEMTQKIVASVDGFLDRFRGAVPTAVAESKAEAERPGRFGQLRDGMDRQDAALSALAKLVQQLDEIA